MVEHQNWQKRRLPTRAPTKARERLIDFRIRKNRQLAEQVRAMIAENKRLVATLDEEIRAEERPTGVIDQNHLTYSTIAKAALIRRDNLLRSIDTLGLELQQVENALAEAMAAPISGDGLQLSKSDAA